ncbi:MAG: phage minor head protein [Bacteroides intestinalis]
MNDVRKIYETYNSNYLRAEHNFVQASATMAAKWEEFNRYGDRYNLQYRTVGDDKVRPEHAALNRETLPITDKFWKKNPDPPNGWGRRCTVVQAPNQFPVTDHDEAMSLGELGHRQGHQRHLPLQLRQQEKAVPDYNPYTISRCRDCYIANGKLKLAFVPDNELCAACAILQKCAADKAKSELAIQRTHHRH